ncbi:MAG TPA: ATP-binding protein [Cyclobacteriaceae bacterium]
MNASPGIPRPHALEEVAMLSADAILIVSLDDSRITLANPAATKLLDVKNGDPLSKIQSLLTSIATEDREYVASRYKVSGKEQGNVSVEFRLMQGSGETVWLHAITYLFNNNSFVLAVIRDVTTARRHENYLVEFSAKKNTLLDTVAHQLNGALTLMNNLAMRAGKLKVATDQDALDKFVSLVYDNSDHCIRIIHDLLLEEHGESPGVNAKFSRVDIVKIITYIFGELNKADATRRFILDTTSPSIFIDTDDFKFLQVINNLSSNAIKFTREGGEIRYILRETDSSVLVAVADDGIGIPENLMPFVFEKHGPARRTGLNGEKSIGLGLSICRSITTLLRGKIWVESEDGNGTTVFIELPKISP